jgi:mannose-1-phosphate guanylyltransferase
MKRVAVIMAGGAGERFWPVSRKGKPKQLLKLISDKSMIEESIDRISPLIKAEDVYIITGEILLEPIRRALPMVPPENIIAEPYKRNTAPCLGLSAAFVGAKYCEEYKLNEISIAVLTSDQCINPKEGFIKTVDEAMSYVEKNRVLCTIGIPPIRPDTGYGYIETDGIFDLKSKSCEIKPVKAFHEKPDKETAKNYIKAGNYVWNSGMFFWRLDVFIEKMKTYLPEVGNKIDEISKKYKGKTIIDLPESLNSINEIFKSFPDISIDYGLMEKSDNVVVAKALFSWDDIGSWDSLERVRESDNNNNITEGLNVLLNVKDSIVINTKKEKEILFVGLGFKNMIVVVTDDAVMVCPKDRVQDVKKCVTKIRETGNEEWL